MKTFMCKHVRVQLLLRSSDRMAELVDAEVPKGNAVFSILVAQLFIALSLK